LCFFKILIFSALSIVLLIQTGLWNMEVFFFVVFRYNSNQLLVFFVLPLSALLFLVLALTELIVEIIDEKVK
jgi:hypothetical protein